MAIKFEGLVDKKGLLFLYEQLKGLFVHRDAVQHITQTEVPSEGWEPSDGNGVSITVQVEGIKATDTPVIGIVQSGDSNEDSVMRDNWGNVTRVVTGEGNITLYANVAPSAPIQIQMEVVR